MNASQLLAWLVCLFLAFGAAVLSVHNSFRLIKLERRYEKELMRVADEQTAALKDVRDVLRQMNAEPGGE